VNPAAARVWQGLRTLVLDRHDAKAAACAELGMSFVRVRALRLVAAGPLALGTLADRLGTDPPYVTVIVDDLQRRGLVTRQPNPADRRSRLVTITPAGETAAGTAERILSSPPRPLLDLDEADLATLDRIVATLLDRSAAGDPAQAAGT
jgi:DNA-binding MarR family transcriptional regulator